VRVDRRRHHRYATSSQAELMVLRDLDVESASAGALTVVSTAPIAAGIEATVRLTGPDQEHVTLHVRAAHCHPALIDGRRQFRVTYAVVGVADRAFA
jgi:hypothetical protein